MPSDEAVKAARYWRVKELCWNDGDEWIGVGRSGVNGAEWKDVKDAAAFDEKFADLLDKMMAQAGLEGKISAAKKWGEHIYTYEGSCGVHMPSNCSLCRWLELKEAELERLACPDRQAGRGK